MKYVALYIRVSTEEQKLHGISIENQLEELKDYCKKNGYDQYRIYNDAGISAHASYKKRPALLQLIKDCKNGEISLILFVALDRWFRSVKDYYEVMGQIGDVPWKATREDYETATSNGRFKVNIMLSVAQQEAEKDSERIRHAMQYKLERGEYTGGKPLFGCKVVDKHFVADEVTAPICRKMFDTYLQTLSAYEAYKYLLTTPYGTWYEVVCDRLKNPKYVGIIVSKEEHDRIISQFKKRLKSTDKVRTYLFSGLMRCPVCGLALSPKHTYHGEGRKDTLAYRCKKNCEPQFNEEHLEKQLLAQLDELIDEQKYTVEVVGFEDHTDELIALEKKIERLKDLYVDGEIDRQTYNKRKAEFEARVAELQPKEQRSLPELPKDWKEAYSQLSRESKKVFWQTILKRIDITDRKHLSVTFNDGVEV